MNVRFNEKKTFDAWTNSLKQLFQTVFVHGAWRSVDETKVSMCFGMTRFGLAAVVIICLFDCTAALTCPSSKNRDAEVLIFGGGIAGITAAKSLFENEITDIKIFEARTDNIGGRMRNADFGGVKIELGANWIQGIPDRDKTMSSIHPL